MPLSHLRFFTFLPAAFGVACVLVGRAGWAQTPPMTPTLAVTGHDSVAFSDSAKTLVDDWEVRVPTQAGEITLQLWSLQNGHLIPLQTAGVVFDRSDTQAAQTGHVYLLRAKTTTAKSGVTMPVPGLGFRFPESQKLATVFGTQKNGYRPIPRTSLSLPGSFALSVYVNETPQNKGILSNQPLALWVGQASKNVSNFPNLRPLSLELVQDANAAAAREKQIPLRPLFGLLNQNNSKGDTLLILILTWQTAPEKPKP